MIAALKLDSHPISNGSKVMGPGCLLFCLPSSHSNILPGDTDARSPHVSILSYLLADTPEPAEDISTSTSDGAVCIDNPSFQIWQDMAWADLPDEHQIRARHILANQLTATND